MYMYIYVYIYIYTYINNVICDIIYRCCDMVLDYETPHFSARRLKFLSI